MFGVLAFAVLVVVVAPALSRSGQASTVAAPTPSDGTNEELLEATRAALWEWGRFAVAGDPGVLTGHFHPDGPQYHQLLREAPDVVSANRKGEAYRVTSSVRVKQRLSDGALVTAHVVWAGNGEPDRRMTWTVELRPTAGGHWALWTVNTSRT